MGFAEGFVTDLVGRTAALKCLGNAVVPQVSELIGLQMVAARAVKSPVAGLSAKAETLAATTAHSDTAPIDAAEADAERALWPESTQPAPRTLSPDSDA